MLGNIRKKALARLGNEQEKKVMNMLLDEGESHAEDFNDISALTYNDSQCDLVMGKVWDQLVPNQNSWKHILKALKLLNHLVKTGSERVVNDAMDHDRAVKALERYNSALAGFHGRGSGRDEGAPIRDLAVNLLDLLNDVERLREVREGGFSHLGKESTKEKAPVEDPWATKDGPLGFGSGNKAPVGAQFGLDSMKGMYDDRPERYRDSSANDVSCSWWSSINPNGQKVDKAILDEYYHWLGDKNKEQQMKLPHNLLKIDAMLQFGTGHDHVAADDADLVQKLCAKYNSAVGKGASEAFFATQLQKVYERVLQWRNDPTAALNADESELGAACRAANAQIHGTSNQSGEVDLLDLMSMSMPAQPQPTQQMGGGMGGMGGMGGQHQGGMGGMGAGMGAGMQQPQGQMGGMQQPQGQMGGMQQPQGLMGGMQQPQGLMGGMQQQQGQMGGMQQQQGQMGGMQQSDADRQIAMMQKQMQEQAEALAKLQEERTQMLMIQQTQQQLAQNQQLMQSMSQQLGQGQLAPEDSLAQGLGGMSLGGTMGGMNSTAPALVMGGMGAVGGGGVSGGDLLGGLGLDMPASIGSGAPQPPQQHQGGGMGGMMGGGMGGGGGGSIFAGVGQGQQQQPQQPMGGMGMGGQHQGGMGGMGPPMGQMPSMGSQQGIQSVGGMQPQQQMPGMGMGQHQQY
jgi:hypothetical protein